jgi:hypothetical protein
MITCHIHHQPPAFGKINRPGTALRLYTFAHEFVRQPLVCVFVCVFTLSSLTREKKRGQIDSARPHRRKPRCPSILSGPETIGEQKTSTYPLQQPQFARQRRRASWKKTFCQAIAYASSTRRHRYKRGEGTRRDPAIHATSSSTKGNPDRTAKTSFATPRADQPSVRAPSFRHPPTASLLSLERPLFFCFSKTFRREQ